MDVALLKSILDRTPDGVAVIGKNDIIEYVNLSWCQLFGCSEDVFVGHRIREIRMPAMEILSALRMEAKEGRGGPQRAAPLEVTSDDGSSKMLEVTAEYLGTGAAKRMLVRLADTTTQEKDKKAHVETESRYRLLVETMRDGLSIDNEGQIIVYANNAFAEMLGYAPPEIVGRSWVDLTRTKDNAAATERMRNRREGKSERYEMEWVKRTGEVVPTIVSAAPYPDSDGRIIGSFAVITEIAEEKDAEETVQFYLDLITHDIANQLQAIMISAGLLEQDVPKSYIEDARHDILDAVERCNRLITKTKRAGQIRGLSNTGVDVSGVIAEKTRVLERVYGSKVQVEGFDDPVWVKADSLLGEMLWNILENAARHNPKDDKQVWVSGTKAEHFFELAVADNGPGLSDDRKKILFDKSRRSGGVGLTLVAQIVRKYGGRIDVQDRVLGRPSMGAKFVLQFQYSEPT